MNKKQRAAVAKSEEAEPPDQLVYIQSTTTHNPPPPASPYRIVPSSKSFDSLRASVRSKRFVKRFFPEATLSEWNDWRWQMHFTISTLGDAERFLRLSPEEYAAFRRQRSSLPVRITPYYISLLDPEDSSQPLRRTVVPVESEFTMSPGESDDPLHEDSHSPVPGLVHRYPDRVLFLVSAVCTSHCRYCTRSRMISEGRQPELVSRSRWERALSYIAEHREVRDVLLSGGDPLILPDEALDFLLGRLFQIPHVEMVRIGTKVPMVLPQRITRSLIRVLKRHKPLWMSIHCTHPDELTEEAAQACGRLADAGIPLGSQSVLLKGVNDNVETMRHLMQGLLKIRVRPYYIYQCDPIAGSAHFRTTVDKGLELIAGLRGHTTGYAVPHYVIDAPGGGGKIPLLPEYYVGREGQDVLLRNYAGELYRYPDTAV